MLEVRFLIHFFYRSHGRKNWLQCGLLTIEEANQEIEKLEAANENNPDIDYFSYEVRN